MLPPQLQKFCLNISLFINLFNTIIEYRLSLTTKLAISALWLIDLLITEPISFNETIELTPPSKFILSTVSTFEQSYALRRCGIRCIFPFLAPLLLTSSDGSIWKCMLSNTSVSNIGMLFKIITNFIKYCQVIHNMWMFLYLLKERMNKVNWILILYKIM